MDSLHHAAELIAGAERLVVFTGAGMSAESGVPTFRDALTGLWSRYDAEALATPEAFTRDPALVWGWYEWRRELVERVHPHAGHFAVARVNCAVITQNVDDLHERAGSPHPIHLHGSLFTPRCSACGMPFGVAAQAAPVRPAEMPVTRATTDRPPVPLSEHRENAENSCSREELTGAGAADFTAGATQLAAGTAETATGSLLREGPRTPPACGGCGEPVRPGVVWFGEALPRDALEQAVEAAANADVLITVGTAGVVHPAAEIPQVTAKLGGTVIQVNPRPTPLDGVCALNLRGTAAEVLPKIIR
ncbi:SIR2 family NAD-dependent protein deacylase [Paractinoplanes brasiliensis]|uniref:NAD-dependent protein deacylase n=1 Tax=Paractinoplanes brasiliensis TaxID=52695 RepID=A0A4R6JY64_9ACTN|nr:NAD-dependent deacylase [Actinoplanes brasiliensis]TDO41327.1 NAD-dependent deacetylase [Actinoplanes brasiliensis]GID27390.1 hypothetical protein Abr02nite_23730 [Actinoplanes brasiliensis]